MEDLLEGLNEAQREAVTATEGFGSGDRRGGLRQDPRPVPSVCVPGQ